MTDCLHLDFLAEVDISRLFSDGVAEQEGLTSPPQSLAVDVKARCAECGKSVRFEGPIGIAIGRGAPPMVSIDGSTLHAAGHMGDNDSPFLGMSVSVT